MQLTMQDVQNNLIFLERVDLKGKESLAHAELTMKLQQYFKELQQQATDPAPAPVDETPIEQPIQSVPAPKPK